MALMAPLPGKRHLMHELHGRTDVCDLDAKLGEGGVTSGSRGPAQSRATGGQEHLRYNLRELESWSPQNH